MGRIVLTTWGSLGDLHPILAVGLGLRDRGHEVAIATSAGYQAQIEALGLGFHRIRPDLPKDPELVARSLDPKTGPKVVLKDIVLDSIGETYADLMAAAQDADLLIAHEIVYAAPLVAETLGLPWASCALAPAAFFSAYEPIVTSLYPALAQVHRLGPGLNRWVVKLAQLITRPWGQPLYVLREELGLPSVKNPIVGSDKYSPHLVLALFSPVLGAPQPDWPPHTLTTGFIFYDGGVEASLPAELAAFLEAGDPPLVFTLGSAAVNAASDFYSESVQAAIQLNRRAVLLIGKNAPPANLPASILAWEYAPYSNLFPHACAIVHQGGVGTTAQALRASRPTLIVPYSLDQPDNAARVQRLGTSRTLLRSQYSAARAAQELEALLGDPSYAAKAAEVGRRLQAEKGVQAACDAVENQLQAGAP